MMAAGGDGTGLDERVEQLVERGLERYGKGDLEGALSEWRHALALDPDHERATDYVAYVEKHYQLRGGVHEPASDPAIESAVPFGIDIPVGLVEDDLDAYESIEVGSGRATTAKPEPGGVGDGYVDLSLDEPLELERSYDGLEDGWNVGEAWPAEGGDAGLAVDDGSIDIDIEPLGGPEPKGAAEPRRTVLGLGDLRDLTPVPPRPASTMPELELELDLSSIELSPSTAPPPPPEAEVPKGREAADAVDIPIDLPLDIDDELTVDRGALPWAGGAAKSSRPPTQDPAIDVASVQVDERLLTFEDATGELDIRDLADRKPVGAARPVPAPPPLPEVTDMQDPERLAESLLAEVDRGAPAGESDADQLRRRVSALLDRATAEAEAGQMRTAVVAAELAVSQQPDSAVVQRALADRSETLVRLHAGFLGDLTRVPELVVPMSELSGTDLDHRTAFLLSRVDGTLSLDDLLDVSGMPRIEALRLLSRLVLRGILQVSP